MATAKALEPAFQGVGSKPGLEIWRIENFKPVPLPKSDYGRFYTGDSYVVLQTSGRGGAGAYSYDIHFWLGKDTSQDEAGTAAIKTVELDAILGGRAVQHRELQNHESDKFLSYFKPCIHVLEGGVISGFKKPEEEEFETRLYTCKGRRVVHLKQVPFSRSVLNHDDVFILDTKDKIFQFNGANSNIQERAKALEVIQFLKDTYHEGTCNVAIVDDGKLQAEGDSGEFWVIFGGFAPIGKKVVADDEVIPDRTPGKLYSIAGGQVTDQIDEYTKSTLENDKCYLMDCGAEVFVWVGRSTQVDDRKAATQAAEEFLTSNNRPKATLVTRLIQGYEPNSFKSNFDSWPSSTAPAAENRGKVAENRGKVSALLKQQQGVGQKGKDKSAPAAEEVVPPLLEGNGKLEVWSIDGGAKNPVASEDIGKFYSGDCYIVLYSYHSREKKEDFYLCYWIGKDSTEEDQNTAAKLTTSMFNSLKGRPVQGRIYQEKEPPQFIAIFQPMIVFKGGLSSGYKSSIAEKGLNDETYSPDSTSIIRILGTSVHNNKATQVDPVPASLNSYECFVIQAGSHLYIWQGTQSTYEQQQWAVKIAEFVKPGVTAKFQKEGAESSTFWLGLGGKDSFTSNRVSLETTRDPHLFAFSLYKGKFEIEEVYNFDQDDLLPEDILILDTRAEVFVWVGQAVDPKEKKNALDLGQKYIDWAGALDGLSPRVPLYRVTDGNEPCFFTTYFSWEPSKTLIHGNAFQKKITILFGAGHAEGHGSQGGGATQRASAMAALNSAFNSSGGGGKGPGSPKGPSGGSQRRAAVAALSSVLTDEKAKIDEPSPADSPEKPEEAPEENAEAPEEPAPEEDDSEPKVAIEEDENGILSSQSTFSYEQVRVKSENPVPGIDLKRREAYLSVEEFESVLGMTKEEFYQLPKWKQDLTKKKVDLF